MNLRKLSGAACLPTILILSGCKSKGYEFAGKRRASCTDYQNGKTIEFSRNGDGFLFDGGGLKIHAAHDSASNTLKLENELTTFTYVEKSDTSLMTVAPTFLIHLRQSSLSA